jgi:SAM-dependent methyltransferase
MAGRRSRRRHTLVLGTLAGAAAIPIGRRLLRGPARDGMAWLYRLVETGERYRRQVYQGMYLVGLTPWDRPGPNPRLVQALAELALPVGRALDIGCGTGSNSLYLAQQGWDVTGVDMVTKPLTIARGKAQAVGIPPRFVQGDVTRLGDLGIGGGYTLLVDSGCFHTIPMGQRDAYVASISSVAAPGSTLLLLSQFARPALRGGKSGVTRDEVARRFNGWELVTAEPMPTDSLPDSAVRAVEWFDIWHYQLRRRPAEPSRSGSEAMTGTRAPLA